MAFKIKYAAGREVECSTYAEAVAKLKSQYPAGLVGHDGDLSDGGDRTLAWRDEEDADDGQNAVAEILADGEDE